MPWNEKGGWQQGGGGGGRGPWGQGPGGGNRGGGGGGGGGMQPPNLEELMKRGRERLKGWFPNHSPVLIVLALIIGGMAVIWLLTGVYFIQQQERGVVLRFGKFVEILDPGIHIRLPQPIEIVLRPSMKLQQINIGFKADPDDPTAPPTNVPNESLMLTGDENIIDIDFSVFWRVRDAAQYEFQVDNVEETIRAVAESAMREAVGQAKVDILQTGGRGDLEEKVHKIMQSALDSYKAGVIIANVNVQRVDVPAEVLAAMRDVNAAKADRERKQQEAKRYLNTVVPKARGEAAKIIQDAEAYKAQQVAEATGEAQRFLSVYEQYRTNKEVTRERMYLEMMQRVLAATNKVILQGGNTAAPVVLPYLPQLRGTQPPNVTVAPNGGNQ
ncbi:MAG: FtsH protease activity modulator HflK [Alphaproteobacteria bacterium]|nr:FtsH protease activity modulator HflK [Alphaproteobacteria bacterium]